jgi:hypothetical protein
MHGTLLYPLPAGHRLASRNSPLRGIPRIPKLAPNLRKRIAAWKRILLAELLRRTGMRVR